MKYFTKNVAYSILVALVFIPAPAEAQVKKDAKGDPVRTKFLIGMEVARVLSDTNGCSMVTGTIQKLEDGKLDILVSEKLRGTNLVGNVIRADYRKPPLTFSSEYAGYYNWLMIDDPKAGDKLLFFYCERRNGTLKYSFVTTDETIFPSIRKSVLHYMRCLEKSELIREIPKLAENEDDMIFLGYLVEYTSGAGMVMNPDPATSAMSGLVKNEKIPEWGLAQCCFTFALAGQISGDEVFPSTFSTREIALKNVIDVATSDKRFTADAIMVLIKIVEYGRFDVRPYLSAEHRTKLRANFQALWDTKVVADPKVSDKRREIIQKLTDPRGID